MAMRGPPPGGARQPGMPARSRLLGREHFAFFRGLLEGVDLERLWDRYLSVEGQRTDLRLVPATIAWIRWELAAAARREERPGTARLLRLDVQRLVASTPGLPSLAQFAEEAGLEDEREADQIEAYQAQYGKASARLRRQAKLLQRQLAALRWLEEVAARDPAPGDAIASWLRPELARFLAAADLHTLALLAERINGIGRNWARSIRGIGPLKAGRIAAWVKEHQATIGVEIGTHTEVARSKVSAAVLAKIVEPATDIRPLEKLVVPADLDGSAGRFRQPREHCLMQAETDYDAVLAWLRSKARSELGQASRTETSTVPSPEDWLARLTHTQRSYRKEAERLMLWAIVQRKKALSSMTAEDCMEYAAFLADPQPRSRWCGTRARERWSPLWRPFEGPLSASARRQAVTILKSLYGFLVDQNYLMGNPWSAVPQTRALRPGLDASRSLTQAQWTLVRDLAAKAGEHSAAVRLRLALDLLYSTGLRASEMVRARVGDLQRVDYFDADAQEHVSGWMLAVLGKGLKLREVPVPPGLIQAIGEYLRHRGLPGDVTAQEVQGAYLLAEAVDAEHRAGVLMSDKASQAQAGIAESTLYRQLKGHFETCADELVRAGDRAGAVRVSKASTHWLRHTHATHALANGVSLQEAQQNLGHASLATTSVYVTTERAKRLRSMQRLWDSGVAPSAKNDAPPAGNQTT
jgi:site-specific recombinase XerD